jgi:HSP20 family protein
MSLARYTTRRPNLFFRDFSKLFQENNATIAVDLMENEDEYIVVANVPGIQKENIEIEVNHEYLEIRANLESSEEKEESKTDEETNIRFLHRERYSHSNSLKRRFRFSKPVNSKDATTELKDGVLTITLPKSEESKSVKLTVN